MTQWDVCCVQGDWNVLTDRLFLSLLTYSIFFPVTDNLKEPLFDLNETFRLFFNHVSKSESSFVHFSSVFSFVIILTFYSDLFQFSEHKHVLASPMLLRKSKGFSGYRNVFLHLNSSPLLPPLFCLCGLAVLTDVWKLH